MSLETEGIWAVGVWGTTVWGEDVWYEAGTASSISPTVAEVVSADRTVAVVTAAVEL